MQSMSALDATKQAWMPEFPTSSITCHSCLLSMAISPPPCLWSSSIGSPLAARLRSSEEKEKKILYSGSARLIELFEQECLLKCSGPTLQLQSSEDKPVKRNTSAETTKQYDLLVPFVFAKFGLLPRIVLVQPNKLELVSSN